MIETYLDTTRLKSGQSLIIVDDNGKRWDVLEALTASDASSDSGSGWPSKPNPHVVLERWKVELRGKIPDDLEEFGAQLPTIYKKAIVLCRSIFTTTGILPAWKLAKKSKNQSLHPACQVRCRIRASESLASGTDSLRSPLFDGPADVTTDYMFGQLEVPVGRFYVSVSYRNNCNFQVVETESLLSSRIGIAISDDMFKPSLPHRTQTEYARTAQRALDAGSLPYSRQAGDITENQQRYGSLSTFHGEGPHGTSPISALRAVKAPGSDTSSPPGSRPESIGPPTHSLPITAPPRRPSVRTGTGESLGRRPSVSFQSSPFKHGSISGSPGRRVQGDEPPYSPSSLSRLSGPNTLTHTRNRSSLTAGMPASLRGGPPQSALESSVAGSPRPSVTNRFSSSFSHRRSRTSFGGASRVGDDDQNSSGKQSLSSSLAQPGSGLLNEAGGGGSSGSFQTDDDNIQDFLKALDSKKTLQSFEPSKKGESATNRTRVQLNKFQLMRESNNALTDSLNSSTQLAAPSSTSSRHIANIPGMSVSSSPGKPLSPHTPHTPAVPSRLSENSSIDHEPAVRETTSASARRAPTSAAGSTAIDIPISPRPYTHTRRSSSAAQKHRVLADDEDQRSISLGADDRDPPSMSALLGRNMASGVDGEDASPVLQVPVDLATTESPGVPESGSASEERETRPPGGLYSGYSNSPYGRRYGTSAGRGATPPQSNSGSLAGSSAGRYARGYTRTRPTSGFGPPAGVGGDETEDEPLLFDMSEINRDQSRRSIEEGRGGGIIGSGTTSERGGPGGYEAAHRQRRWQ